MKKHIIRKVLSLILVFVFVFQILPLNAIAKDTANEAEEQSTYLAADNTLPETELTHNSNMPLDETTEAVINEEIDADSILAPDSAVVKSEQPAIIGEDKSLRTEYSKHFLRSDGAYVIATYAVPVHHFTGDCWEENDNSLYLVSDTKDSSVAKYRTEYSAYPMTFPATLDKDSVITVSAHDRDISFGYIKDPQNESPIDSSISLVDSNDLQINAIEKMVAAKVNSDTTTPDAVPDVSSSEETASKENEAMKVDIKNSAAAYYDVDQDIDLEYEITGNALKESIVVKAPKEEYTFDFNMDLAGLFIDERADGSIALFEDESMEGDPLYIIAKPYMMDSAGEYSEAVSFSLKEVDGTHILSIAADTEWINSDDRVFPVIIDPSILVDVGASNVNDTYVIDLYPTQNRSSEYYLYAGMNSLGKTRSYIHFNLPTLPNCSVVVDAKLHLAQDQYDPGNVQTTAYLNVYDIASTWNYQTITWNNQPNAYSEKIIDYTAFHSGSGSYNYELDITKIVKKWYEQGNNNGLMLASSNESTTKRSRFYSSRYNGSNGYPLFSVAYINNTGLEDYWSYETVDLGRSGTLYINDYNGALTYVHNDVCFAGGILPLNVQHFFNSENAGTETAFGGSSKFGKGFRTSFVEMIIPIASSDILYSAGYRYKLQDADGTFHFFKTTSTSGQFQYEFDSKILLKTDNASDHKYGLYYEDGSKKYYNTNGYLLKTFDKNNNTITITYSGSKPISIKDSANRTATFSYDTNNRLSTITDPAGRVTTFTYSSGNLTQIKYPDQKTTNFYYTNGLLTRIIAFDTTDVVISYKTAAVSGGNFHRLESVRRRGSGATPDTTRTQLDMLFFFYWPDETIVGDGDGNKKHVAFDNAGRAVTVRNHTNMLVTASYENNINNAKNSLKHNSDAFTHIDNLLTDHSFENSTSGWTTYIAGGTHTSADVTAQHYIGSYSRKLTLTSEGGVMVNQDCHAITAGKTYTASIYAKITAISGGRVGLSVEAKDAGNNILQVYTATELTYANNTWDRLQVTFTVPSNATYLRIFPYMYATTGTVYFDCAQLEENGAAGRYNLLTNSGFGTATSASLTGWTPSASGVVAEYDEDDEDMPSYVKFTGNQSATRTLTQTVTIGSSSSTRTAVFGGLTKGFSSAMCNDENNTRRFGIQLELYAGSTLQDTKTAYYNANAIGTLQGISAAVSLPTNITKVKLVLIYNYEVNTALFDDIYLYLDNYGTEYTHDSNGRLTVEKNNAGDSIHYTYTGQDITKISYKKNNVEQDNETYTYDAHHNVLTATTATGIKTTYTYPTTNKGLPTKIHVTDGGERIKSEITYTYDSTGNYVTSMVDARGKTTSYSYSIAKDLLLSVTDPNGKTTSYTYDANTDELTKTTGAITSSTSASVNYQYNAFGSVSKITHNGFNYNFTYDVHGRPTKTSVGSQALCTYAYNSDGTLKTATYGNGVVHKYLYDNLDRVTGEQYNGTTAYSYYYGADGALGRYVDHANNITANISYDLVGRVTDVGFNNEEKIHYTYDSKGNTSSYYYRNANGKLSSASYTYTDDGLPATTTLGNTAYPTFNYTYDPLNRLTKISHAVNGERIDTEYSYVPGTNFNKTGLVAAIEYQRQNANSGPHADYAYAYDNNGNITSVTDGTTQITYQYDGLNRLTRENNQQLNKTITYTYDNGGNILNKKYYAYTTGTLGSVTQTITYTYDNTWKDKLLTYNGGSTITYDAIGNPLSYMGKTLTWQKGRQLSTVNNGTATYTYKYDVNGQRIKKISGGTTTTYRYVSGLLISQTNDTQKLYFRYDANGTPRAVKYNGTDYYYLYNLQGDVVTIYDNSGSAVVNYTYDSWGKRISITGTMAGTLGEYNPFRYRGYVYDTETGFYYLNSRYYDPETGRFINADDRLGSSHDLSSYNLFAYCNDNPIMMVDPDGTVSIAFETVAGALGISVTTLLAGAVGIIICVALLSNNQVQLSLSQAMRLLIDAIAASVTTITPTPIPSKLLTEDGKCKTPDTHPDEFKKTKEGYQHKKTKWIFEKSKESHYGERHWHAHKPNAQTDNYHNIGSEGNILS